jgi:hypothetical protein
VREIPGTHALVTYARDAVLEFPFSDDLSHMNSVIESLEVVEYYGGSDITSVWKLLGTLYSRTEPGYRMIILSDGGVTTNE